MESLLNALGKFFGVALRGQTYLNALYLFLSFPLGIFYFVFLVTGLAMGFPLIIIWVGLLILLLVFTIWYALLAFERQMAIWLLREDIPPMTREDLSGKSLWEQFKIAFTNPVTWKGLLYLFAKFPLGILSFVVLVTLASVSLSLLTMPLYYQYVHPNLFVTWNNGSFYPAAVIDTLGEALLASLAGFFLTLISLHIFNGLAWVSGKFARVMLGNFSSTPAAPAGPALPPSPEPPASPDAPASPEAPAPPETPIAA